MVQGWGMGVMGTPQQPRSSALSSPHLPPATLGCPHTTGESLMEASGPPLPPGMGSPNNTFILKEIFTNSVIVPQLWGFQI